MKYPWLANARFISWQLSKFWSLDEAREEAKRLAATGANTVLTFGYHYRFEHVDKWPQIKESLRNIVTACHEAGIRVIEHHSATFVPPEKLDFVVDGVPLSDCTVISGRDGKPAYFEQYGIVQLCCNNPKFRKIYFDYVLDLAEYCGIDGLMSDDIEFCPDWFVCTCDYCREKFGQWSGRGIPNANYSRWGDHGDFWFRDWLRFRMRGPGDYYTDLRKAMDRAGLNIPLLGCLAGASNLLLSQMWGMTGEEFARGVDLNFYEAYYSVSNFYLWRTMAAEISYYLGIGRRFGQPMFTLNYTRSEDDIFFMWAFNLVQGDRLWLNAIPQHPEQTFLWENAHEELFKSPKTLSNVALLFSRQTRDVYGEYSEATYIDEWTGWSEMLAEENVPYDTILDADLADDLSRYRLLILPNAACMSEAQAAGVRRYVENGGKVIATGDLAFCYGTGEEREKSALADWISDPPSGVIYHPDKVGATQEFITPDFGDESEVKWVDIRDKKLRDELLAEVVSFAEPLPWRLVEGNMGVLANVHRVTGEDGDFLVAHLLNVAPLDLGESAVLRKDQPPVYDPKAFPGPVTLEIRGVKLTSATLYSPDNAEPISLPIAVGNDASRIHVEPDQVRRYGAIKIELGE